MKKIGVQKRNIVLFLILSNLFFWILLGVYFFTAFSPTMYTSYYHPGSSSEAFWQAASLAASFLKTLAPVFILSLIFFVIIFFLSILFVKDLSLIHNRREDSNHIHEYPYSENSMSLSAWLRFKKNKHNYELNDYILNQINPCVAVYSGPDLEIVYANSSYLKRVILSGKDILNKSLRNLAPQLGDYFEKIQQVIKTGNPVHLNDYILPFEGLGDKLWNIDILPCNENSSCNCVVTISYEITEQISYRKKAEELSNKLEEKVNELKTVVEYLPAGIIYLDENKNNEKIIEEQHHFLKTIFKQIPLGLVLYKHPEMTVVDVNEAFLQFTKPIRTKDNIINLNPSEFINGWKACDNFTLNLNKKDNINTSPSPIPVGDRYFDIYSHPIVENGKTTYWLEISNDVTQLFNYTKNIEEISKLKEDFFANISHEFKTPLTVILGTLQLMSKRVFSESSNINSKEARHIKVMKQNCFRLLRLINNLLDITRLDSGYLSLNLDYFNIVNVAEEITLSISNFALEKEIDLEFDTDMEEAIISIDIYKIEKVILNLLSNAIKFTDRGGKVSVYVKNAGKNIEISIKDTGVGIPQEKSLLIFERFFQIDNLMSRKHEGSGIGLYLVKSLVELHNGTISVSSVEGKGSEFIISLPKVVNPDKDSVKTFGDIRMSKVLESTDIEFSDIPLPS